jgi:hypothetical protein
MGNSEDSSLLGESLASQMKQSGVKKETSVSRATMTDAARESFDPGI